MNILQPFDATIFNFINHTIATDWLDYIMVVITEFGNGWAFGLLALFLLRQTFKGQRAKYIGAFSGLALGAAVNGLLKHFIARPRPVRSWEYLGEQVRLVNGILTSNSFPSGHTFSAFATATIIAYFRPRLAIPAYLMALLVGISRMYVAAHFPTDVLVGAFLGTVFTLGGIKIATLVTRREKAAE